VFSRCFAKCVQKVRGRNVTLSREPLGSDLLSVIERQNRAKLRERATAAEGGTHVYLNSIMKHEFTLLLLLKSESPAISGDPHS
jgi:hypothetical protein